MMALRFRAVVSLLALLALPASLAGCGGARPEYSEEYASGEEEYAADAAAQGETGDAPMMQRENLSLSAAPAKRAARPGRRPAPAAAAMPAPPPQGAPPMEAPPAAPEPQAQERMVHYRGHATLRSTEPEKTMDSAVAIARKAGGYLERRYDKTVVLRVPAKQFDTLFQRLMRLGEVIAYSQEAEDITEAYQDTDMRLNVVVATLQRLEALIKKARTESQKMMLLERLRHLREEREVLEARKRELSGLARFATITMQLQGHDPNLAGDAWQKDVADFLWIHRLDPFKDERFRGRKGLKFEPPAGMAVTSKRMPWRATGAKGAEFWGSRMKVDPRGDARFWSEAVRLRLKDRFKAADTSEAGGFRLVRFRSHGPTPYYYWVGVQTRKRDLHIVEIYFPSEALQSEQIEGVLASVERGPK